MHTHTHTHTKCDKVQFCMVVDVILNEIRSILGESDEFLIKKRSVWRI